MSLSNSNPPRSLAKRVQEKNEEPWGILISDDKQKCGDINLYGLIAVVGRETPQLVNAHNTISAIHLAITPEFTPECTYKITDFSTNGTFVNGRTVGYGLSIRLMSYDEISLGFKGLEGTLSFTFVGYNDERYQAHEWMSQFTVQKCIGNGSFGTVRRVRHNKSGVYGAMKLYSVSESAIGSSREEAFDAELKILNELAHPNIVSMLSYKKTKLTTFLVIELAEGGSLQDEIDRCGGLSLNRTRLIMYQIVQGVRYMHSKKVVHRDLKPDNILLARQNSDWVKITDFGTGIMANLLNKTNTFCGTPAYMSPEIVRVQTENDKTYDAKKNDCWAIGIILYQVFTGKLPFTPTDTSDEDCGMTDLFQAMKEGNFFPYEEQHFKSKEGANDVKYTVHSILQYTEVDRPEAFEIMEMPFFKSVNVLIASLKGLAEDENTASVYGGKNEVTRMKEAVKIIEETIKEREQEPEKTKNMESNPREIKPPTAYVELLERNANTTSEDDTEELDKKIEATKAKEVAPMEKVEKIEA
ncbi:ovarian-specific serine/threonine protein kinase Lok, putative [Entamoeba invadens IP1]|uniref:Ovarian-specific serine/threonine protein kinase Lok, putative n=2 Tax=Entamoeba invadens TaxID=33085 RepID=A0A0A1UB93_ENTIV|nr:ovarian-specific serine/threonine protein kinase Lok, putative [Entamoeba invadens IP1]ELP90871.1 ovarian-specific serine/threonine protein kinase Lok, putative [Entamoeba invadens IP1]BAN41360.1 ovarian-specific serine/threonine protein kinase Lok, putative [Entamoeba invadens]|eukprot:XP_004257642.1 ovarian-specific serine/threonine protein kinase Lok, putative [Entamoeba invadens IP1]